MIAEHQLITFLFMHGLLWRGLLKAPLYDILTISRSTPIQHVRLFILLATTSLDYLKQSSNLMITYDNAMKLKSPINHHIRALSSRYDPIVFQCWYMGSMCRVCYKFQPLK